MFFAGLEVERGIVGFVNARPHPLLYLIFKFNMFLFYLSPICCFYSQFARKSLKIHISLFPFKLTFMMFQMLHLLIFNALNAGGVFARPRTWAHLYIFALLWDRFWPSRTSLGFFNLSIYGGVMSGSKRFGKEFILCIIPFLLIGIGLNFFIFLNQTCLFGTHWFLLHMHLGRPLRHRLGQFGRKGLLNLLGFIWNDVVGGVEILAAQLVLTLR